MGDRCHGRAATLWLLASAWLWACSSSHREPGEEPVQDAGPGREGCGADAECADGLVCVASRCVAKDAGQAAEAADAGVVGVLDAGVEDPLVERVVSWHKPLEHLPPRSTRTLQSNGAGSRASSPRWSTAEVPGGSRIEDDPDREDDPADG